MQSSALGVRKSNVSCPTPSSWHKRTSSMTSPVDAISAPLERLDAPSSKPMSVKWERPLERYGYLARIAPFALGELAQIGEMQRDEPRRLPSRMPGVPVLDRAANGAARMSADPDGDMPVPERLRLEPNPVEGVMLAVKTRLFVLPKRSENPQILVRDRASMLIRRAQRLEFLLQPADPDAANRAPARSRRPAWRTF